MKKVFYILVFILATLFYGGTALYIENRTEAEDAFEYAMMVESAEHVWNHHPHHLLYGPAMQLCYRACQTVGYEGRAYGILMWISSLSAAGSLFFFFLFCYHRFSLRPLSSLIATVLLAVSYGFWRYAAEVEIILPATFLGLAALYYATEPEEKRTAFLLSVAFSSLAILMHIMNSVVIFAVIPCFYLLRYRWKFALGHLVLSTGIIGAVFFVIAQSHTLYSGGGTLFSGIGLGSLVKAMVALSQCVVSGDFVLGFRSVRVFLGELFASRMLSEEFFLGVRLSRSMVLFSLLTYVLFIVFFIACLARAMWVWKNMVQKRNRFQLPTGLATIGVVAVWFFVYAGILLFIEPGNPELWVMGLVPLYLLFCGLVLLPLTVDNRLWLPFGMMILLFVHNGMGGMKLLGDPAKDYQRQKAAWILEYASSGDVVITAGDPVFERYLRYHFKGQVVYLYRWTGEQFITGKFPVAEGSVYVMGDVFNQLKSLQVRFPEQTKQIDAYAQKIRPQVERIIQNEFGGIYQVKIDE